MINTNNTTLATYKNFNINHPEVKKNILAFLCSKKIPGDKFIFEDIISTDDLDNIRDNNYIICPRLAGTRSWIIFFNIDSAYYAVTFPKRNRITTNTKFTIYPIEVDVSQDLYRGTIMEGIFYRIDDKKFLVVDEIYFLCGKNQLIKSKDDRLNMLSSCIKNSIRANPNYSIYVSQFFEIEKSSICDLYEKIKKSDSNNNSNGNSNSNSNSNSNGNSNSNITEIIFYPKIYGRTIYKYTLVKNDLDDAVIKITIFQMQKTANPDVYYLIDNDTDKKIDIAYIPDISTSKKCRQWFKDNKVNTLIVKCQMDNIKKKWVPLELVVE